MANAIREKSIRCIEWTVESSLNYNGMYVSKKFTVQNCQCNLEFRSSDSMLFFRSNGKLQSPVNVTVNLISENCMTPETRLITSNYQWIWNYPMMTNPRKHLFVFEVIIHTVPSKDAAALKQNQMSLDTRGNTHLEGLSRDISMLLKDNSSCDVEITCETQKFKAHRIVLGTRSPVLSAMLKSKMVEGKTGLIKIEDIKASIFECFLQYLYSGKLPKLSVDTAKQFYVVGDKYDVNELKIASSEFLTNNLSEVNACEMLVLADQHSDANFQNEIMSYIVENKIPQRDSQWPTFCEKYPLLAIKVQNLYIQKHCSK